jgi:hypothetical protein
VLVLVLVLVCFSQNKQVESYGVKNREKEEARCEKDWFEVVCVLLL